MAKTQIINTEELHLSGLIGTSCHLDTQNIRIIGFFFENRLHWQFEFRLLLSIAEVPNLCSAEP